MSSDRRRNKGLNRRKYRDALTWFGSSRRKKVPVCSVPSVIVQQDFNLEPQPPLHVNIDTIRNDHTELANGELCNGPHHVVPQETEMDKCVVEIPSDEERQDDTAL